MEKSYKLLLEETRQANTKHHAKQKREHAAQYKPPTKQFKDRTLEEDHAATQVRVGLHNVDKLLIQPLNDETRVQLLNYFISNTEWSWDVQDRRKAHVIRILMKQNGESFMQTKQKLQMLTSWGYWLQMMNKQNLASIFRS